MYGIPDSISESGKTVSSSTRVAEDFCRVFIIFASTTVFGVVSVACTSRVWVADSFAGFDIILLHRSSFPKLYVRRSIHNSDTDD